MSEGYVLGLGAYTEGESETNVAFHHVAHIGDAITELQSALQAHAEGEAGVPVSYTHLTLPTICSV